MDEDPDFDYDMAPQAIHFETQNSAEELMDEIGSEAMTLSDAGMHPDPIDKAAIDVDFPDSVNRYVAIPGLPTPSESLVPAMNARMREEDIDTTVHVPSEDQIYHVEPIQQSGGGAADAYADTDDVQVYTYSTGGARVDIADGRAYQHEDGKGVQGYEAQRSGEDGEEEEDELSPGAQLHASQSGVQLTTTHDEGDQLDAHDEGDQLEAHDEGDQLEAHDEGDQLDARDEGEGEGEGEGEEEGEQIVQRHNEEQIVQGDNGEAEGGQDVYENGNEIFHSSEDHNVATVRVMFNGQDFVIWSTTDIAAYLAASSSEAQTTEGNHHTGALVHVEAPALEVEQEVLWQPLDSFFASLREQKALGDFLEESHELHLFFPDLDLEVAEDNLYCREITLDDLFQLHHGLGLATSLHIQVSERPRFITKYNELAQHVAGILGNQLQHSSDEEQELTDSGRRRNAGLGHAEAIISSEPKESETAQSGTETVSADTGPITTLNGLTTIVEASTIEPVTADTAFQKEAVYSIANKAPHGGAPTPPGSQPDDPLTEPRSQKHVAETEHQDLSEAPDRLDEYRQEDNPPPIAGGVHQENSNLGTEGSFGAQQHADEIQSRGQSGGDDDVAGDKNGAVEEQAEYSGHAGRGAGDSEEDAPEGQADHARVVSEDGPEGGDEEYEDDTGDYNEEAEQTFYTINNNSSEAEEDELEGEEGEDAAIEGKAGEHPFRQAAEYSGATYTHEMVDDQREWQEGAEDHIVEYTEDQRQDDVVARSPSSAASTTYEASPPRKRSLVDDDEDNAQYEEGDYETESKRVKVV